MPGLAFLATRWPTILNLLVQHLVIVLTAMVLSMALGLGIGLAISSRPLLAKGVLNGANVLMTLPSLALFSLLVPLLGLGKLPAIAGIVAYTQLPVIRNVCTALNGIDPAVLEAARGMGLTERAVLWRIRIPLALPGIFAGIRTALVMGIGIGAIAGYIGAGGLGVYIFQGISRGDDAMVVVAAVLISLISILADRGMGLIQRRLES